MRNTCDNIFGKQYIQSRGVFILLCLDSHDIYYLNTLSIITLLYHLYIEHELYERSYLKNRNHINENLSI